MLRFPERCFEKIHVKSSNVIEDLVTMSGDEPFVISVDALREDGKVLKHFNIPVELPIRPKGDPRIGKSFATTLPLKKRYQINQEQNDKAARYRRLARKPILKRMLQESGGKFVRVPQKVDVQNDEIPLDLSRIRRQEVQENSAEVQRLHQVPRERLIQVPQQPQQPAVHYPVPLRYLVQPYPQVRLIEEPSPEVPRIYAAPQNARPNEISRLHNSRPMPSYSYPHVVQSAPYMRPSISYHHPNPGRYYDACQDDSVPPRRSYHLAVPPNYAPVSEVPYIEDGYIVPRHLAEHYAQYPSIPPRYVTHAPVICNRPPPPAEVVPKNPPAAVYSNQPNTYAFHPPSCIPPSNYVPQVAHHPPPVPQNPPHISEIPSNRQRTARVPSDVRHLRDFLLENAARQQRVPAQKVNNYPDEIPVFRLRNPTYNSASSSAHDPSKGIRYSHTK